ncbi:MAG: PAS domain S-box protein [Deltaproteobacteria bacterium]|nr:PAS domain S-box protein [Deltaproteobacteria bacterium]
MRPEIAEVRERLLHGLLLLFTVLGSAPFLVGVHMTLRAGELLFTLLYAGLFLSILACTLLRRHIPYTPRGVVVLIAGMGIGAVTLFQMGLAGIGIELVTVFSVFAAILFGLRGGLALVVLSVLAISAAGFAHVSGLVTPPPSALASSLDGLAWLNAGLVFIMLALGMIFSSEILRGRLEVALNTETQKTDALLVANLALREAERATGESERRFRELAELLPESVFETDLQARLTFANQAAFTTFGYEPEDLERGLTALDMLDPGEHPRAMDQIQLALGGEGLELREYLARHKDGTTFPVLIRSAPIVAEGRPVGLRGFIIDISEKKQAEARFHAAQRMEAVGTLAGGIAHDFNNLLMGIQGRASLLERGEGLSEDQRRHLASIEAHVESAAGLTRQLLGLARGGKYETRATDLNALLERTLDLFGRTHKNLELELDLAAAIWSVEVDRTQLEQVFLNLLLNAAQAMPGGGRVSLTTRNLRLEAQQARDLGLGAGPHVEVMLRDTGPGMDEAIRERIFEPFFTTKGPGLGTGLGLASAYGIVNNHGGSIEVESTPGEGSTFRILLPAREGHAPEPGPRSADELPRGDEALLLVDDEQLILSSTTPLLKVLGYEVTCARGGLEAIEIPEQSPGKFALVILDMVMPEVNGAATFERIQRLPDPPRVLLSSGYSSEGAAAELLAKGCAGFLQKPYRVQQLAGKLREILDAKEGA